MLKQQIRELRNQGLTQKEIAVQLGCAKSTVCYHLNDCQKAKNTARRRRYRKTQHPYTRKVELFLSPGKNFRQSQHHLTVRKYMYDKIKTFSKDEKGNNMPHKFTVEDVIDKFGEKPQCYLTGQDIDIYKPQTYQFDHIIPRSRGGDNSLDNLGICISVANQAKHKMTLDEFVNLCEQVVKHQRGSREN